MNWERIENALDVTERAKIPGGWLVRFFGKGGESGLTFVPDPQHTWNIRGAKIAPHVGAELAEKLANPLVFQWSSQVPRSSPTVTYGYDVTFLIDLCKSVLAASDAGAIRGERYQHIVKQAHVVLNASAKLGIKALVHALAGYDATKEDVIAAFKFYVREEARAYEKEFPDQLYEEWYRLFIGKKQRQVRATDDASKGDAWVYVAIDADKRLKELLLDLVEREHPGYDAFVSRGVSDALGGVHVKVDPDKFGDWLSSVRDSAY